MHSWGISLAQESLENEARTEGKWRVETTRQDKAVCTLPHWPALQAMQRQHYCLCSVQARCSQTISYNDVGPAGVCFTAQRHAR